MPKIVQIIASRHESYGGPSIAAAGLNEALRSEGADAILLSASYVMGSGGVHVPVDPNPSETGIFHGSHPHRLMASRGLRIAINRELNDADLVHIHGQYLLPNVYAYLSSTKHATPYGVQVHGSLETYQRQKSSTKKAIFGKLVGNRSLANASYVLFASNSEADRAADLVSADRAMVEPLGVSLSEHPARPSALESVELPDRRHVFVFLGRLAKKKRPELLLEAWAAASRDPKDVLVFAGPDEDFTAAQLKQQAKALGCDRSVFTTGSLSRRESSWMLYNSGVFLLPSENENFAIAVGEAMLAGCYVVTTRQVAAHEHVERAGCGKILDTAELTALTEAISACSHPSFDYSHFSQSGIDYAYKSLSWNRVARRILERI